MATNGVKETFYDILQVPNNATIEEIKKSYRQLALRYHPDKNLNDVESSTKMFNKIQEAYEMLIDPQKRNWYENHMDEYHKDTVDITEYDIDQKYFTNQCFKNFDDGPNGFYTVYRLLFDEIIAKELTFYDDPKEFGYPEFGNSKTDIEQVKLFYDQWQSFSTAIIFSQLDKYDIRQAPNRKILRIMEKKNKKIREEARKRRNQNIQNLVNFLRKIDKRMEIYRTYLGMKKKENRKKSEMERKQMIKQNLSKFKDYVEPDWTSMKTLEQELQDIEAKHDEEFNQKRNKKKSKKKVKQLDRKLSDSIEDNDNYENGNPMDNHINDDHSPSANKIENNHQNEDGHKVDDDDEEDDLIYLCDVCNKNFKSINSFENHQKSKKHLSNLQKYIYVKEKMEMKDF